MGGEEWQGLECVPEDSLGSGSSVSFLPSCPGGWGEETVAVRGDGEGAQGVMRWVGCLGGSLG